MLNLLKRRESKRHTVPLDQITLSMLQNYISDYRLKPDDALFNFSRELAFYYLRKLGKQIGIEKVGTKGLHTRHVRHSHCIAYIRANNTMEGLRKLQRIGHASIYTTATYLQYGIESRQETEDIFGKR